MSGRRLIAGLLALSLLLFSACFDYRGLGEQTIAAGIAVDFGEAGFTLTFETVDVNGADQGQFGAIVFTTTGETFAEAVQDAASKLHSNVYLGALDVLLLSTQAAEDLGVSIFVDYLLRDKTVSNSLPIVIAGTDTAGELLMPPEGEEADIIRATSLAASLSSRQRGTGRRVEAKAIHEIYNILERGTSGLALPIVGLSEAEDIPFQLDGLAIFHGAQMAGTLSEADIPLYLLATTSLRDWAFPVEVDGERLVLQVRSSRPQARFGFADGQFHFFLDVSLRADVRTVPTAWGELTPEVRRRIETEAEEALSAELLAFAQGLRDEGRDIFGFAEAVANSAPHLWNEMSDDWKFWLESSEIHAWVQVELRSAGLIR